MKTTLTATVLSAALLSAAAQSASAPDYQAVQKDMAILQNILTTASQPEGKDKRRWMHRDMDIRSVYLANQGMVFTIELPGAHWGSYLIAPMAPLPPMPSSFSFQFDGEDHEVPMPDAAELEETVAEAMEAAAEVAHEFGYQSRGDEKWRAELSEVREALRKSAKDYREYQRKFAEGNRNKVSDKEKQKLQEQLSQAKSAFEQSRKAYHEKAEKMRAESAKQWQEKISEMESTLLNALCSYASSTRRLSNNENVSLILQNAGQGENKHRVWVVSKSLLDQCVSKIQDNGFLRKSAISYES